MSKPLFSIVLIARNESKTLSRLITSLSEFKDRGGEVILLDTGSTDDTVQKAKELGCIVTEAGDTFRITINAELALQINQRFIVNGEPPVVKANDSLFDYASARNYAATLASNNVCFTPDCDEQWDALDIDVINEHIINGAEQFEYNFIYARDNDGKPLIQFMHSKAYDRRKLKWDSVVHEVLSGEAKRVFLPVHQAQLSHYQNIETNRSGYLKGLAYDCFFNQDKDRQSHYFSREMLYTGRYKSAIREFERHISMDKWPTEKAQSMLYIGDCNLYLGNKDEAVKWYMKSFDLEPNRREPLMKMAEIAFKENKHIQVIAYCKAALELSGVNYYATHQPYYEDIPHSLLYWAYWYSGNKEKSKEHYDIAFSINPKNQKYIDERCFYYPEKELQFTGERVVPDKMQHRPDILREHIARYEFAAQFTKGLKVLDAACGTGYAKPILQAQKYIGLDNSREAIDYATEKYGFGYFKEDLEYPFAGEPVDITVSFETIEHLDSPSLFLDWVSKNSEAFIFSIPIEMLSEFHKLVFSVEDVVELMTDYFKYCIFYGQDDANINALGKTPKYVVGVAANELPSISIVIPTLGREEGLKRCLDSIEKLNYPQELIEVIVLDDNIETIGVPKRVKEGVEKASNDWVLFGANDIEFTPDSLIIAALDCQLNNRKFLAFNTGELLPDKGNICEHFVIHKSAIAEIGEVFDTRFHHVGVDNILYAKMEKLGYAHRNENAVIKHYHFSRGGQMDSVYELGWSKVNEDRALLAQELEKIN